jgi:predicted phosphodiesterase
MRFAILADIHANFEALQDVLIDTHQQRCTHYACLGDIVGYNANPKECLDLIRNMKMPVVKGNHDEYCSNDSLPAGLSPAAAKILAWARNQLTAEDRRWLRALPYVQVVAGFTIVHGHLEQPERWQYVFDREAAATSFARQQTAVCFFGHTHVPMAFIRDNMIRGGTYSKIKVEPDKTYFVNPGSVGQPRDNNPQAAYAIYDLEQGSIELRRVDYDVARARQKIMDAGLGPP